jgi:hypothetical protein
MNTVRAVQSGTCTYTAELWTPMDGPEGAACWSRMFGNMWVKAYETDVPLGDWDAEFPDPSEGEMGGACMVLYFGARPAICPPPEPTDACDRCGGCEDCDGC